MAKCTVTARGFEISSKTGNNKKYEGSPLTKLDLEVTAGMHAPLFATGIIHMMIVASSSGGKETNIPAAYFMRRFSSYHKFQLSSRPAMQASFFLVRMPNYRTSGLLSIPGGLI
jgi:hypothetical protein